jgi:predicted MPP superfamily phosphohydrolase
MLDWKSRKVFCGHRWALLVGVNRYTDTAISDLKVCASDVQAAYDTLSASGCEPDRMRLLLAPGDPGYSPTRAEILSALTSVAQAAGEGDMLLFYFSGHGIARDGKAYILPADARYTSITDTAIDINRVKQIIQESAARAKVIVLDACHSGAQIGKAPPEMTEDFVRHVFAEAEGMAILASCKQKQVSWEWPEKGQSVFTYYLLEGLRGAADLDRKGFVTVGDINQYITDKIKTWTVQHSRVQTPTLQYTVAGDIVLVVYSPDANLKTTEGTTLTMTRESDLDGTEIKDVKQMSLKQSSEEIPIHGRKSAFTVTWLHLSDLHFRVSSTYDSNIVLEAMLRDVAKRIRDDHLQPDFIIISGDIAFAGRPEEYALAQRFLDDLLETTGLPKKCLFLVPGNHDVDRSIISPLAAGATAILNNRGAVNDFLVSAADRALVFQRFHNYQHFVSGYLGKQHLSFNDEHYFYVRCVEVASLQVAILGLNSAWLSASDSDRNQLVLGERQVRTALGQAGDADLRIAVMHHPFDWLRDFDRADVEPLLRYDCDYILHGHMHQIGLLQARAPDNEVMVIAAGACYETRQYPNSYNYVQLDRNTCKGMAYLRMYSGRQGGFWTKDMQNYRNVEDGTYTFPLPGHLCLNRQDQVRSSEVVSSAPLITLPSPPVPDPRDLRDWKTVHSTVQNLLFSTELVKGAFELFEKQPSESTANRIEEIWLKYCEPKARRIRQSFPGLQVVGHDCIEELLSLLQGKESIIVAIQFLRVDDAQSIRQLQSSIHTLVDTLKEALILADVYVAQIAEYLISANNKSSR